MQKRYLTLLIAAALFTTACSKEKAAEHKAQDEHKVERLSQDEQNRKIAELEARLNAQQQYSEPAPVLQTRAQQPTPAAPVVQPAQQPAQNVAASNKSEACHATTDGEISALFDRWNASLKTGKSDIVVSNYAADSILLPTVSNKVRHSAAEKADYFDHFLENGPVGEINERYIKIGCNTALDAGVYTFHFAKTGKSVTGRYSFTYEWNGDKWLITSHHSSVMPEQATSEQKKAQDNAGQDAVH